MAQNVVVESDQEPLSRKGYALKDLARSFLQVLGETGPVASGKLLHFTADMVCSGVSICGKPCAGISPLITLESLAPVCSST